MMSQQQQQQLNFSQSQASQFSQPLCTPDDQPVQDRSAQELNAQLQTKRLLNNMNPPAKKAKGYRGASNNAPLDNMNSLRTGLPA